MKQARTVLSTYSADVFGVCSALYELGGMVVMHDASGCNSTYSTHDEPRWYDTDSMILISGLTEMEAIMGDDAKVQGDMLRAIEELRPAFAALAGTPIPMLIGCDLPTVAAELEKQAGIPCFGFETNGMRSYLWGASRALEAIGTRFVQRDAAMRPGTVNILGATPLDFSLSGTVPSMVQLLERQGWSVIGTWAMGSTLEDLRRAGEAQVNLVVSGVGLKLAERLRQWFGTPYVVGTPTGAEFSARVLDLLEKAAQDGQNRVAFDRDISKKDSRIFLIGEAVTARSLAAAIGLVCGTVPRVIDPLEPVENQFLSGGDRYAAQEEDIQALLAEAETVIADPLYRPILPKTCRLISLPHEAFSGRMFRKNIPDLVKLDIAKFYGGSLS